MADDKTPTTGAVALPRSRRGFKGLISDTQKELKKVIWPSHAETFRLSSIVLSICVMMAVVLWGLSTISGTLVTLVTKGSVN